MSIKAGDGLSISNIPILLSMVMLFMISPSWCYAVEKAVPPSEISSTEGYRISSHIYGLPGLSNVGWIDTGVYRGAQPKPDGYLTLKKMGIRVVLNLRAKHTEEEAVQAAGMRSIEIPMGMLEEPEEEKIMRIIEIIRDPANKPIYFHCALGEDRTGVVGAVYRMMVDGWSYDDAISEMQDFGFNDIWINLRHFLRKYSAHN